MSREYLKGTFATFIDKEDGACTVRIPELARVLTNWADIPLRLNNSRAQEIGLLAEGYLDLRKKLIRERKKR
jgi:hypothetical protein